MANDTVTAHPIAAPAFDPPTGTSPGQDGLWFLGRMFPASPAHNLCRAYDVTGDLDVPALATAWRAVLSRHEILRTSFEEVGGRPVARVATDDDRAFALVHPGGTDDAERRAGLLCAERAATPMDPAVGPLARLTVMRVGAERHVLLLVLHRLVADDRSVSIVTDELSARYAAAVGGASVSPALPAPATRYADHARQERTRPADGVGPAWWTSVLTPPPPALTLPVDGVRPVGPSSPAGVLDFDWGTDLARAVGAAAAAAGTTPFAVLLSGLQLLLHRWSGTDRVAVGVATTTRPDAAATVVGPFDNLLVLPADLSGRPGFGELLARVGRLAADAVRHRDVPFPAVVRALAADRDPQRIPLCDVVVVEPDGSGRELALAGTRTRHRAAHPGETTADLTLVLDRLRPFVAGRLEYRADLFTPATAGMVLRQLRTLLSAALAGPDVPVDRLPLEDADRIGATVRAADGTAAATPAAPVHETVRDHAQRRPHAPAIAWHGEVTTYRELAARAARIAGALRRTGGVVGSPVAVRMPPGPDQIAALLGVLGAGGHLVWLGTGDGGERARIALGDLRPSCLLVAGDAAGDELVDWYRGEVGGHVVDGTAGGSPAVLVPTGPGERAYVAHTSGSTGRPKGIAQSHGALAQFVTWMARQFGLGPGSRVAQWVAPEHDPALCEVFATLVAGATLCPVPERVRRNPDRLADWLVAERITVLQTVPSFARELLKVLTAREAADRPALDRLLLMGEALPAELVNGLRAALPATRIANLYGPTETIAATSHEITGPAHGTIPIGRPIPGRHVLVLDGSDRPCPAGVTGEIVVRSPYATAGYLGAGGERGPFRPLPDLRDSGVPADPSSRTYRTGDLGRWREDGLLEFRGRKDFQVKLAGNRLELTEVEAALAADDSVAECAVVADADADGLAGRLLAYVVARTGPDGAPEGSVEAWRALLRRRFGRAMLPVTITVLDRPLPRGVAGKVDRSRLPRPARAGSRPRAASTSAERRMAAIWTGLLGVDEVGAEDTLFTAGGHSLLVPCLLDRIRGVFGVEVHPRAYFADPTVAGLAALVDRAGGRERHAAATAIPAPPCDADPETPRGEQK